MLRGIKKVLVSTAVALPLLTFATSSAPAEAIPPSKPVCFFANGPLGDVAIVNLTPMRAARGGDGQLVPINLMRNPPLAANVNFGYKTVDPNVAFSTIGTLSNVCFINSVHGTVEVTADQLGTIKGAYYSHAQANGAPLRVLNTRTGPKIPPRGSRCFRVAGTPGDVAVVNLTPVQAARGGDGQLVSSDIKNNPPVAANVNFTKGSTDPNIALAKIGADNQVCFINSVHTAVHLIADHLGTINGSAYSPAQANGAPLRVLNTRTGAKIPPSGNRCFRVAGTPGDVAVVNLTPVQAARAGDGQLVSSDIKNSPPKAANVNFALGTTDPNVAFAKIGADNQVCFINSVHTAVHVIADHLGNIKSQAFTPAQSNGGPLRLIDTRTEAEVTPAAIAGPLPTLPSISDFACGWQPTTSGRGISTFRVRFAWPDLSSGNKLRITLYNDPKPNQGNNYVAEAYAPPGGGNIASLVRGFDGPARLLQTANWNGRVKIETFIGTPNESATVFDISDQCFRGQLTSEGTGDSFGADDSGQRLIETANEGQLPNVPGSGDAIEFSSMDSLD